MTKMMCTYWRHAIDEALKRNPPEFTKADEGRAQDWVTCACGEQDPRIPRDDTGRPKDHTLARLGELFYDEVRTAYGRLDVERAASFLRQIEARATVILKVQVEARALAKELEP